jgi:Uma2 family endonuclease
MVLAEPVELKSGRRDTVVNPVLVAEVLSDSTAGYDRGDKFAHYRTIESLQEYLLIAQDRPYVEHYVKQSPNQWLFTEYASLENLVLLMTVSVEISLADLYEAIEF